MWKLQPEGEGACPRRQHGPGAVISTAPGDLTSNKFSLIQPKLTCASSWVRCEGGHRSKDLEGNIKGNVRVQECCCGEGQSGKPSRGSVSALGFEGQIGVRQVDKMWRRALRAEATVCAKPSLFWQMSEPQEALRKGHAQICTIEKIPLAAAAVERIQSGNLEVGRAR